MNSLSIISPYKYLGMWVFDDARVGLTQEPFVGGADTMIDALVAQIPNAEEGFRIVFSSEAFPGFQERLAWVRAEMNGNVYRSESLDAEGWLCPALFKYFEEAPREIYLRVEAIAP
jgi:hypothetical protein